MQILSEGKEQERVDQVYTKMDNHYTWVNSVYHSYWELVGRLTEEDFESLEHAEASELITWAAHYNAWKPILDA